MNMSFEKYHYFLLSQPLQELLWNHEPKAREWIHSNFDSVKT